MMKKKGRCSDIDNQEECDRIEGCEWSDNAGCIEGEWEDDEMVKMTKKNLKDVQI